MDITLPGAGAVGGSQPVPGDLIKDSSTAEFPADVIEASKTQPVLVDFWAPWCGPCKQLGPAIEKAVTEQGGKVKLVKINVDENQALAGQMGIQSIPAVYAFAGGRPVDGFMGALPESQIKEFIAKVLSAAPAGGEQADGPEAEIAKAVEAADQALAAGDAARAAEIYGMVLQHVPDHTAALVGLAQVYIKMDEIPQAKQTLALVKESHHEDENYKAVATAIQLAEEAEALGDGAEFEARIAANPDDHEARFDLAMIKNAHGDKLEAAELLVDVMKRDREWEDDGARKKLLELFEAWGPKDEATVKGRRMLSSVLFS